MHRLTKTTAAVAGAVALVSGAYALGSQAGDGSAQATAGSPSSSGSSTAPVAYGPWSGGPRPGARGRARRARAGGPGFGAGLADLATRLGTTQAKLQTALDAVRPDRGADDEAAEAKALADALGISQDKVQQAFAKVHPGGPGHRGDFAAALAKELGKSTAEVEKAFEAARPDPPAGRPEQRPDSAAFVKKAADALGVSEADLQAALRKVAPGRGGAGGHGVDHGAGEADLAAALGVSTTQLQAASDKLAKQRRDDFAAKLADKLGIEKQKVLDALPAERPHGRHP